MYVAGALFVLLAIVASLTEIWLFKTWGSLEIDEIVYHLKVSLEGTNTDVIVDYLRTYGAAALLVSTMLFGSLYALRKHRRVFAVAAVTIALGSAVLLGATVYDLDRRLGVFEYLTDGVAGVERTPDSGEAESDFIEGNYVDPKVVDVAFPERRRNLVYLYLESMETTYADLASGGAFNRGCIPELTAIAQEEEDFSGEDPTLEGAISLPGSTWTVGAMFAQTSGLPLKVPVSGNFMSGTDDFFPQFRTIGDVLADEGYRQVLLIGSQAEFGGRSALFSTHGGYELHDYDYAREMGWIPEDYRVWWGYEDERLFAFAREELLALAASGEPFNLTMLTADTHFEDGYVCDLCGDEFGDDQYANVMACSSRQVADFVAWMRQQDFWENTTVVICGDHPTMDSDFCQDVPADYQRRTLTAILNAAVMPVDPARRRSYSTMDLFPTTLAALGAQIDGERLGLGTNLFSGRDTLVEELGLDAMSEGLSGHSAFLSNYLGPSVYETALDSLAETATLDARPALADTTLLALDGIDDLEREYVLDARVELRNVGTGTLSSYHMMVVPADGDDSSFACVARVPVPMDELSDYRINAYLWVRGIDRYPVATYEVPEPAPFVGKEAPADVVSESVDDAEVLAVGTEELATSVEESAVDVSEPASDAEDAAIEVVEPTTESAESVIDVVTTSEGEGENSAVALASERAAASMRRVERRVERIVRLTMGAVASVYNGRDS